MKRRKSKNLTGPATVVTMLALAFAIGCGSTITAAPTKAASQSSPASTGTIAPTEKPDVGPPAPSSVAGTKNATWYHAELVGEPGNTPTFPAGLSCRPQAKVIYRHTSRSVLSASSPIQTELLIYQNGAWLDRRGSGGCLTVGELQQLQRAIGATKFTGGQSRSCRAMPTMTNWLYTTAGHGYSVDPCGPAMDRDVRELMLFARCLTALKGSRACPP